MATTASRTAAAERDSERKLYLDSLRANGRVIEADSENVPLPAGVTHVLVKEGSGRPRLVEKRKSFF